MLFLTLFILHLNDLNTQAFSPNTLDERMPSLLAEHQIPGSGIGVLRNGKLIWSGYYGLQKPGVPANRNTLFNTASMAKTVTAEVTLRLVSQGLVALDELIADHYQHPDLGTDPRYRLLTPRILLTHQAGLLNWAYAYPDQKLAFIAEPGSSFTYSGAGYRILADFLAAKLDKPFPKLVAEMIGEPVEARHLVMQRETWIEDRVAHPMTAGGQWFSPFAYPDSTWEKPVGQWSAGDDLYVTVEGYAAFLTSVMKGEGLSDEIKTQRFRVSREARKAPYWGCHADPDQCPTSYGYGLGWTVFHYGEHTIIQHGGNDLGEHAFVYFDAVSLDGLIIFVNGGNGYAISTDIVEFLDQEQKLTRFFRSLLAKYQAETDASQNEE